MSNRNNRVTIIIPVYNTEPYLHECFNSVIYQTFREIEIILVDDGSTDKSGQICDEYGALDNRIIVIHKHNGGLSSARNAGLKLATGEYIYFLDSDDYIELNTIEKLYFLAKVHNLDMVLFTAKPFVDGNFKEDCRINNYEIYLHHTNEVMNGIYCLEKSIERGEYLDSSCIRIYRSSLFDAGRRLSFQEGIIHEDLDIGIITLLNSERVMKVNRSFYHRRYRSGSIMTNLNHIKSSEGYMFAIRQMMNLYDTYEDPALRGCFVKRIEDYLSVIFNYYVETNHSTRKQIAAMIRKLGKEIRGKDYRFSRKKIRLCLQEPCLVFLINKRDELKEINRNLQKNRK